MTRSAYYKGIKRAEKVETGTAELRHLVLALKHMMPCLGGRKTFNEIKEQLLEEGIKMGRDKFFEWLRKNDLLVKRKRSYAVTTDSRHRFRIYENLAKDFEPTAPDQLWVSDITYLRLAKGFCYLALITDAYSRKIIGYNVNNTLELEGCLKALEMAERNRSNYSISPIHHSDRGVQYCSNRYVYRLKDLKIKISMAAAGNCYENAMAERINGILKTEFNLDATFADIESAKAAVKQGIFIYNRHRPHMALNYSKPNEVYAA